MTVHIKMHMKFISRQWNDMHSTHWRTLADFKALARVSSPCATCYSSTFYISLCVEVVACLFSVYHSKLKQRSGSKVKIVDASGERALLWQNSKTILNSNIHVANQSSQILSFWDPHYLFSDLYFSAQTPEEKPCPIIEPKNYVSPENSTFSSLKPLTVSLSWSFLLKMMLSPTL